MKMDCRIKFMDIKCLNTKIVKVMNIIDLEFIRRCSPLPFGKSGEKALGTRIKHKKTIIPKKKRVHWVMEFIYETITQQDMYDDDYEITENKKVDQETEHESYYTYNHVVDYLDTYKMSDKEYQQSVGIARHICFHCRRDYTEMSQVLFVLKKIYEGYYGQLECPWNFKDVRFVWCAKCLSRFYPQILYTREVNDILKYQEKIPVRDYDECYKVHLKAWGR
ncbi:MAG: hypothetical protein OHK0056_31180 [Bacteriovoracaceae bacterium]